MAMVQIILLPMDQQKACHLSENLNHPLKRVTILSSIVIWLLRDPSEFPDSCGFEPFPEVHGIAENLQTVPEKPSGYWPQRAASIHYAHAENTAKTVECLKVLT